MTSKALVGPLPVVRFHDGTKQAYEPPRNTCDKRYPACTEHHPACDCREAEFAEQMAEHWIERRAIRSKAAQLLAGHRLFDHGDVFTTRSNRPETDDEELRWRYISGDGPLACQCTGCQVIRAGDVYLPTDEHGVVTADAAELSR